MLLEVRNLTVGSSGYGYVQIALPSDSKICAANTIVASFFNGQAEFRSTTSSSGTAKFATKITDYGQLVSNSASAPSGQIDTITAANMPVQTLQDVSDEMLDKLRGYMHIVDGVVLQPGYWEATGTTPSNDLKQPNMGKVPVIRLKFDANIEVAQILLTGFLMKTVLEGETGLSGSVGTDSPSDGDFLGPQEFPWAAKITFTVPTSYIQYFLEKSYSRKLPTSASEIEVNDTPIIDMRTTDPGTYYGTNFSNARVAVSVTDFNSVNSGDAVLTVYQKLSKYPPALYGTYVTAEGNTYLNPLDVVAPGNIKVFPNGTAQDLIDWEAAHPGTRGMVVNNDGTIQILNSNNQLVYAAQVYTNEINYTNIASGDTKARLVVTKTGNTSCYSLSMADANGTQYIIGTDGTSNVTKGNTTANVGSLNKVEPPASNINWAGLLDALANNKSVDILGDNMKVLKKGLNPSGNDTPYLQLPNGLRLYICSQPPTSSTTIPEGSIGIGW